MNSVTKGELGFNQRSHKENRKKRKKKKCFIYGLNTSFQFSLQIRSLKKTIFPGF